MVVSFKEDLSIQADEKSSGFQKGAYRDGVKREDTIKPR